MRGWKPSQREEATETVETAEKQTAETKPTTPDAGKPEAKQADEKSAAVAAPQAGAEKPDSKAKPEPNLQERMEGLQGWLAEIERKQRRTTRITTAVALLAVVAAAAAIALSLMTRSDTATQDDVDELKSQLDGVTEQVTQSTQGQLKQLSTTVGSFDGRIATLEKTQGQVTADINALRRQVNSAVTQANQQATTPGTTTTPAPAGGGGGGQQQP